MKMTDKQNTEKGKQGQSGTWTSTGFQPKKQPPKPKPITLLDILLGKA